MFGKIYKFRFLGSVTECDYQKSNDNNGNNPYAPNRKLVATKEAEPFVLEFKIAAYSKEKAERKLKRFIAWHFENNHSINNYND